MMTTEEILEMIQRLPPGEKDRIRRELSTGDNQQDAEESVRKLLQISGSAKVGRFLNPDLDREFLYSEDPA